MASFVHRCPNLGTIIWKFRNLSLTLLENAWPNEPDFQSLQFDKNDDVHWCLRMPPAKPFPPLFFHSAPWDLRDKCVSVVELQTQTAIRKNMQYKHHLLEILQFLDLFPVPENTFLRTDTLSPIWVGRRRRNNRLLNWELEALNLTGCQTVRSVATKPLQFWLPLGVEEIKAHISPPKSARRQFVCQHKFFSSLEIVIAQHLSASSAEGLPHLPEAVWSEDIPICCFCSNQLNFIQIPQKIHRQCSCAQLLPRDALQHRLQSCQLILRDLATVISRF